MTAPSGARLPRSTAMPAFVLNGSASGRITPLGPPRLPVVARRVLDVVPHRLAVDRQRVAVEHRRRVRAAPPAGRRRSRSPPSGTGPTAAGRPGRAGRGRSGPSPRARASRRQRPASASRWITALVEPPIAALARIAFSNAARVRIFDITRSSSTISTMRRPAMRASTLRRPSTAGIAALPGSPMPSASTMQAIVEAVPIVMQWPCERCMQLSASKKSAWRHRAGAHRLAHLPDAGAGAEFAAAELARQHRPARDADRRQVDARRAHQQRRRGLVAAHQQHDAVERIARGSIPRRPCWRDCGTASPSAASASRRATSPGTRAESRRPRARPGARARRARGSACCRASARTRCCRCRSPAGRRTGRAGCRGSSSTSGR